MTNRNGKTEIGSLPSQCPGDCGARQLLRNVEQLRNRLCDREERLERISSELERTTGVLSLAGGGSGCVSSRLEALACEKDELEREYLAISESYSEAVKLAYSLIDSLPDDRQRRVLTYLYIECGTLSAVSDALGYSKAWIKKLHYRALQLLDEKLKKDLRVSPDIRQELSPLCYA